MKNQTLGIKSSFLHLSLGFYTLFHCDLEFLAEGRSYPCIRIVFLLNSRKSSCRFQYRLVLYRYRLATGAFLHGCPGTGWRCTDTGWLLVLFCMGVPVQVGGVPVQVGHWCFSAWVYRYRSKLYRYKLPLHLFFSIVALPETSPNGFHHPQ